MEMGAWDGSKQSAWGLVVPPSLARRWGGLLSVRGSLPGSVAGVGTAWLNAGEREK